MASVDEIKQEITDVRTNIRVLERDVKEIIDQQLDTNIAINAATDAGNAAEVSRLKAVARDLRSELNSVNEQIEQKNSKLGPLGRQLQQAEQAAQPPLPPPLPPPQSAAVDVAASSDGATQNPATPPTSTGRLTNDQAATLASNTETGTNAPVKTLTETQSVSPVAPTSGSVTATEGRPGGQPGVGAKSDDGTTAANTRQIISAATAGQAPFQPRNNVLDQYASYTYNIGWYLLTPEQQTALQETGKTTVSQYNLLVQSGGAPADAAVVQPNLNTKGAVTNTTKGAGRNPFFGLDYYLDNLEIKSTITGKGSNRAHNAVEMSFTVIEPAAITLIDNLWKAVKSVYKEPATYVAAYYALIIRFYGYDQNGKIIQASDSDNKNAVVEKIIPFRLTDIQFSVSNKLVEYQIKAAPLAYLLGFGSNLGVVKAPHQISGATVKDLLTKGVEVAEVSPADGRKTTNAPAKSATPVKVSELPAKQQAAIAAGTDANTVDEYNGRAL
jgi:hypothetical protein